MLLISTNSEALSHCDCQKFCCSRLHLCFAFAVSKRAIYIFQTRYIQAKLSVHDRSLKVATVIESLEMEMELLCLTGVEDQLQTDVRPTLEILRNAGIKVWLWIMLTLANKMKEGDR